MVSSGVSNMSRKMITKIYLSLLTFCVIFSQGIGIFSMKNNEKSSNLYVRKKRLIDKTPNEDRPEEIQRVPYIVSIHKNEVTSCIGTILSPNMIITAAHCVEECATYIVLSGSSLKNLGTRHHITGIIFHPSYHPTRCAHDFALLIIFPLIDFVHSPNREITLHNGSVPVNTFGTVSGWDSNSEPPNLAYPDHLRSINVPTISLNECRRIYGHFMEITEKSICTLDICGQKRCDHGDSGAPFVVADKLVGIHTGNGHLEDGIGPDVFINLSDAEYRDWVHLQVSKNPPNHESPRNPLNTKDPRKRRVHT